MKKQFLTAIALIIMSFAANAQVGIGTATPNSGAALDITSTDKGLLLPRVANTAAIASPVNGMMIYDLSSNCFKAYQNNIWSDCGLLIPVVDQIQAALTTNQATYIAAAANTWVAVTPAEFDAVLAGVTGAAAYGMPTSLFTTAPSANFPSGATWGVNSVNATPVPASSYPVAMRFRTQNASTSIGQLKLGATIQNSYNNYGSALPSFTTTASGTSCFVLKAPTTALTGNGYIALYTDNANISLTTPYPSSFNYFNGGNIPNGTNLNADSTGHQAMIQVVSTSTKTW